jgi:hypothetical protein
MALVQARRVEPKPHRAAPLAEDANLVDAADAFEDVDDVVRCVVADEDAIVPRVARREPEGDALFFVTVTPVLRTSAGSRPIVLLTWFCTSFAARSMLRSSAKVQTIVVVPLLVVVELM